MNQLEYSDSSGTGSGTLTKTKSVLVPVAEIHLQILRTVVELIADSSSKFLLNGAGLKSGAAHELFGGNSNTGVLETLFTVFFARARALQKKAHSSTRNNKDTTTKDRVYSTVLRLLFLLHEHLVNVPTVTSREKASATTALNHISSEKTLSSLI